MPLARLAPLTPGAANEVTARAQKYLTLAHSTAEQAFAAMQSLRTARRAAGGLAPSGRTSDQDQDLLRAMLVFACAGVDAAMKTLIGDALPVLADLNPAIQKKLDKFAVEHLSDAGAVSPRALASVLSHAESPRQALVEGFVQDLTGGSLQSAEELDRVCEAFGIEDKDLRRDVNSLGEVFRARNQIIHELDLNPWPGGRTRRDRDIGSMTTMANQALGTAQRIVNAVSEALNRAEAES